MLLPAVPTEVPANRGPDFGLKSDHATSVLPSALVSQLWFKSVGLTQLEFRRPAFCSPTKSDFQGYRLGKKSSWKLDTEQ